VSARDRAGRALATLIALIAFGAGRARAQEEDVDSQRFTPHVFTDGYLQTEGSAGRFPIDPFSLGLWLSYAHNALIVIEDDDVVERIVDAQVAFDLTASYAFASWFELGVHAPLAYLSGDDVSEAALGDLRLLPKFRLLDDASDGVGLALIADVRLPTHTSNFYGGARMPAFTPKIVLDHHFGMSGVRAAFELGALLRKATQFRNVTAASELQAGLGLGYRFDGGHSPVELLFDLRSAIGLAETDPEEVGLEGMFGAGIDLSPEWKLQLGAGLGLLEGFGIPTFRAIAGVRWEPSPNDPDRDGIASPSEEQARQDATPAQEHGDAGGAPPGAADEEVPSNVDEVDDAERARAIAGGYDACPDLPEDLDGDEDEDGCPEGDQDGDGVLDYLDRCSDEPEMINGFKDDDGCPDEGPAQIIVEQGKITILGQIRFEIESAKLTEDSYPTLDQIALTLRAHRELQRVDIAGHTDSTGSHGYNVRLSRDRARAVRQYLLQRGIPPARLSATGYGPDRPIADNETEDGRAKNRRVEFLTVD
jgi:outer membrane protein OmpA-like peptidoglycan-associated protein